MRKYDVEAILESITRADALPLLERVCREHEETDWAVLGGRQLPRAVRARRAFWRAPHVGIDDRAPSGAPPLDGARGIERKEAAGGRGRTTMTYRGRCDGRRGRRPKAPRNADAIMRIAMARAEELLLGSLRVRIDPATDPDMTAVVVARGAGARAAAKVDGHTARMLMLPSTLEDRAELLEELRRMGIDTVFEMGPIDVDLKALATPPPKGPESGGR